MAEPWMAARKSSSVACPRHRAIAWPNPARRMVTGWLLSGARFEIQFSRFLYPPALVSRSVGAKGVGEKAMSIDYSMPVLVVDDYQTVLRITRSILQRAGFKEVDTAADGEEALAKMRERRYGLVLCDWYMAPLDGLALVKQARADDTLKAIPIILVSGEGSPENLKAANDAGASGYVLKPFDSQTLKAKIETALAAA
jgi:two-component system chemotaxis response regulator CheY